MKRLLIVFLIPFFFSCAPEPEVELKTVTEKEYIDNYKCLLCDKKFATAEEAKNCFYTHNNPEGTCYLGAYNSDSTNANLYVSFIFHGLIPDATYKFSVTGTSTRSNYSDSFYLIADKYGDISCREETSKSYALSDFPSIRSLSIVYREEQIFFKNYK